MWLDENERTIEKKDKEFSEETKYKKMKVTSKGEIRKKRRVKK